MTTFKFPQHTVAYDRKNPYFAKIKERKVLNHNSSSKQTYHIVLDLKDSGIIYDPGDAIGILPSNDPQLVLAMLDYLETPSREETLLFLTKKANLVKATPSLLHLLLEYAPQFTKPILEDMQKQKESLSLTDVPLLLKTASPNKIPAEAFCSALLPLLPRFYSTSSSMKYVGEEVHILVATFSYMMGNEHRRGVASQYLSETSEEVPLYIQKNAHFKVPSPDQSMIMIGPGTGIAPYRGFMQERSLERGEGKNWIFFGERNRISDFYYEEEWNDLVKKGLLTLSTAFSRDQKEKIYVQHQLIHHSAEVWSWIDKGALVYICGDAKNMAKDVTQALEHIAQHQGNMSPQESHAFIKDLRKKRQLLLDVY